MTTAMPVVRDRDTGPDRRPWKALKAALQQALAQNRPIQDAIEDRSRPVRIALSGGADSLALLHAAARVLGRQRLRGVHINHGLHRDAATWQRLVQQACDDLGVTCDSVAVRVQTSGSQEDAARRARYRAFSETLRDGGVLLLAHHRRDAAETVLLRALQGRAVAPMPALRPLGDGWLLRPFLALQPQQLRAALRSDGIGWLEDPSNLDTRHDRNALRHGILPLLRRRFVDPDSALIGVGDQFAGQAQAVAELTTLAGIDEGDGGRLQLDRLALLSEASAALVVRRFLLTAGSSAFSDRQLQELVRQLRRSAAGASPELHADPWTLRAWRDGLWLLRSDEAPSLERSYPLLSPRTLLPHGELLVSSNEPVESLDALTVTFLPTSERLRLRGRAGSKTLSRWLSEAGVPPWERASYPVILRAATPWLLPNIGWIAPSTQAELQADKPPSLPLSMLVWQPFRRLRGAR